MLRLGVEVSMCVVVCLIEASRTQFMSLRNGWLGAAFIPQGSPWCLDMLEFKEYLFILDLNTVP